MRNITFVSSIELINPLIVWTIFGLSMVYLFVAVKNKPRTFVSYLIILAGMMGIFEYSSGFLLRMGHFFIYMYMWLFLLIRKGDKPDNKGPVFFLIFSACYFFMAYYHGFSDILSDLRQYVIYSFPFLAYMFFDKFKRRFDYNREIDICIIVFNTQIVASVLKLVLIGFNEKLVGIMSISGGGIAALFPIVYFMIIWFKKNGQLDKTDYFWILASLIVSISSNKRAVWFIFPVTMLCFFLIYKKLKLTPLTLAGLILIPFVLYFGVRFNPSLNPENRVWGSFDPAFVYNYVVSYNLGGSDYYDPDVASGRLGTNLFFLNQMIDGFFDKDSIFGSGNYLFNLLDARGKYTEAQLSISSKFMLTGWTSIFVRFGLIVLLPFFVFILLLTASVGDKTVFLALLVIFLPWFLFYTASIITVPLFLLPYFLFVHHYRVNNRDSNYTLQRKYL